MASSTNWCEVSTLHFRDVLVVVALTHGFRIRPGRTPPNERLSFKKAQQWSNGREGSFLRQTHRNVSIHETEHSPDWDSPTFPPQEEKIWTYSLQCYR